jgi:hypothetical protein
MSGLKKFLYITADGFHSEQAASDELELGALTMSGYIAMGGNKVTGLAAGANAEESIAYGQAGAALSGLDIYDADIAMGGNSITGLGAPSAAGDATNKEYVDNLVTAGRTWREVLLHDSQVDTTTEGILSASLLYMNDQPESGDLITITNGTITRTYGCVAGGDVQYAIGANNLATMENLATAIEGDGTAAWNAYAVESAFAELGATVVVIIEKSSGVNLSKIYGAWHSQGHIKILDFTGLKDYNLDALTNMPITAPATANFGFHRTLADLNAGELHNVRVLDTLYTWDEANTEWVVILGPSNLPDGTSASGGGTKGKLGVDSDLGLEVNSGILGIDLASSGGLEFDGSGDLQVHVHDTTPGLDIDGSNGLRVTWDGAHGIIVGSSGIELEIDDTPDTLDVDGDGLKVVGVPSEFKIGGSACAAAVSAANLTQLTDGSETVLHTHAGFSSSERTELEYTVGTGGVTIGDPVYLTAGGDTVAKADADDSALAWVLGIAMSTEVATDPVDVTMGGVAKAVFSGKTAGTKYYLGDGGGLATSVPASSVSQSMQRICWLRFETSG